MTWSYRIIRKRSVFQGGPYIFGIHDVCCDEAGVYTSWTSEEKPWGLSSEEVKADLVRMLRASNLPVLEIFVDPSDGSEKLREVQTFPRT